MQKLKNLQLEKKIYIKTTKYESGSRYEFPGVNHEGRQTCWLKGPKLPMGSKVTPVDGI